MKNIINNLINELVADKARRVGNLVIFKSAGNGRIYVHNTLLNRAYCFEMDGKALGKGRQITLVEYNQRVKALQARLAAAKKAESSVPEEPQSEEGRKFLAEAKEAEAERERIAQWKREHNEAEGGVKPSVVDNSTINAPATKTAVLLDAEREDSGFDYRQAEDVLSMTEAEAYEVTDSLLEEDKVDLRGYHKAVLLGWKEVKGRCETRRDGSRKLYKPYIELAFDVDGYELKTRAYAPQYNSFKIQANYRFQKLFTYMKDSVALDQLVGDTFDIWVKFNELLGKEGEFQAEFYDRAAYEAKKRMQEVVSANSCKSAYGRPTEDKATR